MEPFNVWETRSTELQAARACKRVQREVEADGHTAVVLPIDHPAVTPRERVLAERKRHAWVVGVFDPPTRASDRVRIPGLNAPVAR